jgi:hypothetical protein
MPEAPLPPGALPAAVRPLPFPTAGACHAGPHPAPAWLDAATFALMCLAATGAGAGEDAAALAREVVAARYPALPAALLSEAALLALGAAVPSPTPGDAP